MRRRSTGMGASQLPRRWILLRGLGRETGHWGNFCAVLKAAIPGCEFTALDLPGAGAKWRDRAPLRLGDYVSCLMKEAASAEPVGLVSLSLGAMVALEWASCEPQSVARMVLINTSLGSQAWPWERFTSRAWRSALVVAMARGNEAREREILNLTSNSEVTRHGVLAEWLRIASARPVSLGNYTRQMLAAAMARPDLSRITATGLVLASRADRLVRMDCSRRLAERLGWPIEIHPTAGHDVPLDDPEWCADRIREWVKR